jgi:hypothetical protein
LEGVFFFDIQLWCLKNDNAGRIARQGVLGQDAVISTNAFEDMGYTMETGFGNSVDRKFASFSSMGSNHGRDSLTSQSLAQPMKPHAGM